MKLTTTRMLLFIATFFGGLTFQCSAMVWDAGIYVRNESNWPLVINYTKNGEPLIIQLGTGGKIAYLGQATEVKDAKYYSSTDLFFSRPITFLNKTRAGDDFMFVITTWYGKWSESEEHPEPGTISKDITGTPDSTAKKENPQPEKGSPSVSETKESSLPGKGSTSESYTAEESMVWVRNDTAYYNIMLKWTTTAGKELTRRVGIDETVSLGKANTLTNLTYHTYGKGWQMTSPKAWPLDLKSFIKANSDLLFKITTFLQVFSMSVEYLAHGEIPGGIEMKPEKKSIEKTGGELDPWDYFPKAKKAKDSYGDIKRAYRLLLNLPTEYTQDDLTTAYRTLAGLWHPDKGKLSEAKDGKVMQIINDAYENLKK